MAHYTKLGVQVHFAKDDEVIQPSTNKPLSFTDKGKIFLTHITVEPVFILGVLSQSISLLTLQNLLLEKGCRVNLQLGKDICDALTVTNISYPRYKDYEKEVQIVVTDMLIWRDILMCIMPAILLLFMESWSYRHKKRKQIILNYILGMIVTTICLLVCTYYFYELPLEVIILGEVLSHSLTGNVYAATVGVHNYINDISSKNTKTVITGALEISVVTVLVTGNLFSGILYHNIGFYGVFGLTSIILLCAYLYGQCCITDIQKYQTKNGIIFEKANKCFLKDFFEVKYVKKTFNVAFKRRDERKKICLLLLLRILLKGPNRGESNISYYYMKFKFGWSSVTFGIFSAFQFVFSTLGNMFGVLICTKTFKLNSYLLGIISCISQILPNFMYAVGPTTYYIFIAAIIGFFSSYYIAVLQSIGSQLVLPEEVGKLYSLFALSDIIAALIYCPIYNKIYTGTIDFYSGTYYFISIVLVSPAFLIYRWMYLQYKNEKSKVISTVEG